MAKNAQIVIGANFGDEGKGLVTDFLSAPYSGDALVVRHNGGAQAGHTVATPDGKRHIFSHFGSGTLAGAQTYLSRFFACNPLLFFREIGRMPALAQANVFVDPAAPITTPYDMMINQIAEEMRGDGRHGSCGVGYGETVARSEAGGFDLSFTDLENKNSLRTKLAAIQTNWVPQRMEALGLRNISDFWIDNLNSAGIFEAYLEEIEKFLDHVKRSPADILPQAKHIVFEGAQGLLLDQDRGYFPHVTRSHTGIRNAATLAQENGIDHLEIFYITRAYNTRHGAGPMTHELPHAPYAKIIDQTNIYNQYQGGLRFGWLDTDLLARTIKTDLTDAPRGMNIIANLAVTCLDQVDEKLTYIADNDARTESAAIFLKDLKEKTGAVNLLTSHGPTRTDVRRV